MKRCAVACIIFLALLSAVGVRAETADKRLALVVGLGAYEYATALPNPPNDARALGNALADLGFEVYRALDSDKRSLETALRDFGRKAADADIALIFFAGHGVQVNGHNYLIPIDATLEDPRDLPYDAVPLDLFLDAVTDARQAGIMIVDACRDNPFVDRLSARANSATEVKAGLSRIDDVPSGTLIAMATRANSVAEDGAGAHSPYTAALLKELAEPGVELRLFFGKVADNVKKATKNRQEPYVAGTLGGTPVYLNPQPVNRMPVAARGLVLKVLDSAGPTPLGIPAPTDPDKSDRLVVQVTRLPRGGLVKVFDRVVLIGDLLTVEQIRVATFAPDGTMTGDAGTFEFRVTDDRGGSDEGSVAIFVAQSNKAPIVATQAPVQVTRNPLGIQPPADPDGDPLTITVTSVPYKGRIQDGASTIAKGDHIEVAALSRLTFDPEGAPIGAAGSFGYSADDGRGGTANATIEITVVDTMNATAGQVAATSGTQPVPETVRGIALEPTTGRFVVTTDANIRDGPSPSAKRIDRVAKGSEIQVLGRAEGSNWYSVVTGSGVTGFIASELLQPIAPTPDTTLEPAASATTAKDADSGKSTEPAQQADTAPPPETSGTKDQAAPSAEEPPDVAMVPLPPATAAGSASSNEFSDCPQCPAMIAIPAGAFEMGNRKGDASEKPVHHVTIQAFAIGKFEVTVAEWRACVEAGGCESIGQMNAADDMLPMVNTSWDDAVAYLKWLSDRTGKPYRLPTEAEWEYAARAGSTTLYWWGDAVNPEYVSCRDCGGQYSKLTPPRAGLSRPNPFGLFDMSGSASEWVTDCWKPTYEGVASDGSARTDGDCSRRVLRGGSWRDDHLHVTAAARGSYDHDVRYPHHGFRAALGAP